MSISMLSRESMYCNDYPYVNILLPQMVIMQLKMTDRNFKEREYI